ncbi:hypothetical protein J3R83DRAFT_7575 [Lanmaoa asiatica]|nr:hypothetical protein J3R83DRAFT_7575 [Lanmaoa asiatica]
MFITIFGRKPLEFNRREQTKLSIPPHRDENGTYRMHPPRNSRPGPTCAILQLQPRARTFMYRTAVRVIWRCSWRSWYAAHSYALPVCVYGYSRRVNASQRTTSEQLDTPLTTPHVPPQDPTTSH